MNCSEVWEAIAKMSVVELEQRLKQLETDVRVTKDLLRLAKVRGKTRQKRKSAENGKLETPPARQPEESAAKATSAVLTPF